MERSLAGSAVQPSSVGSSRDLVTPEQPLTLLHDFFNWLSVIRNLKPTDVIVLLSPVVIPIGNDSGDITDPFEYFGKRLRDHHDKVRHVPYTMRNGIVSTHVGIIRRGTVVVFIMSEPPKLKDAYQIHAALVTREIVRDETPLLIVLTCRAQNLEQFREDFPTIIQSKDYRRPTLESIASFIFGKDGGLSSHKARLQTQKPPPRLWQVEPWNESRDIGRVYDLWTQSIDVRFAMHITTLAALLRRPGYARHYVVRDSSGQLLGFSATFLSYVDQGENLILSLSILLVDLEHRCQGIGLSLHNYAIDDLKRTRGVSRIQLGSTFPRIFYGPPCYMEFDQAWFTRRGWRFDGESPGQGQPVYDMLLDFASWNVDFASWNDGIAESGLDFRDCTQDDMPMVLEIVGAEIAREHKMGWFDQYLKLVDDFNVTDILVITEDESIVAVALTYTPLYCSPISSDLPWGGQIGEDVGGVTCICIPPARRDFLLVPLLGACIQKLQDQGMKQLFLDAVTDNVDLLKQLGFKEWAQYRDVWEDIKLEQM